MLELDYVSILWSVYFKAKSDLREKKLFLRLRLITLRSNLYVSDYGRAASLPFLSIKFDINNVL